MSNKRQDNREISLRVDGMVAVWELVPDWDVSPADRDRLKKMGVNPMRWCMIGVRRPKEGDVYTHVAH
jgi:hypothetical protein